VLLRDANGDGQRVLTPVLSVLFATCSVVGGILVALGTSIPISPYVTTISFAIYLACRIAGRSRSRRLGSRGRLVARRASLLTRRAWTG
jgi:zinc/manganese transport system permease protein